MQRLAVPQISPLDDPVYRSSDGKPMSDNTKQYHWIVAVQGGLDDWFAGRADVLVVGNLLWYPVEDPKIRAAPDVMVIFGRPKGDRGSYIQIREDNIAPQVVFEVLSPGNRAGEMQRKLKLYEQHGVEEYYVLDPDFERHKGYERVGDKLEPITELFGWTSPRLGVRFELTAEFRILTPDGRAFEFLPDVMRGRREADLRADEADLRAEADRRRAITADRRVDEIQQQRDAEKLRADKIQRERDAEKLRADEIQRERDADRQRAERLIEQLRALGIDPDA